MNSLKYVNVVGIISFIIAIFDKEHIKHGNYKEKYFNEFLVEFYAAYRKNDFNMKEFFNCNYSEIYIPPYVYYLYENKRYEDLKKVLLVDYYIGFPNEKNSIIHTFIKFISIIDLLYYFFVIFVLFGSIFLAFVVIFNAVVNERMDYINIAILLGFIIIYTIIALKIKHFFKLNDSYSYKEEIINKLIKSKLNDYNKISNELYFL